jgi:hypothetical protein
MTEKKPLTPEVLKQQQEDYFDFAREFLPGLLQLCQAETHHAVATVLANDDPRQALEWTAENVKNIIEWHRSEISQLETAAERVEEIAVAVNAALAELDRQKEAGGN